MLEIKEQSKTSKYIALVKEMLGPDEQVELIIKQTRYFPLVELNSLFKPKIIFCTNTRIIIMARNYLGLSRRVFVFPYYTIKGVNITRGIFLSTITIVHSGIDVSSEMPNEPNYTNGLRHNDMLSLEKFIREKTEKTSGFKPTDHATDAMGPGTGYEKHGLKCLKCGASNDPTNEYCHHCGVRL